MVIVEILLSQHFYISVKVPHAIKKKSENIFGRSR